ncbi:uncharacterized protein [Chironomus tepperi]|uniref:uncharacterized protein n=1 Tax=Chironomus tepperi TaxID=113505 RepID=UPI00391F342E
MNHRLLLLLIVYTNLIMSLNIECEYGFLDSVHAYGDKYRCLVKNDIDIELPEEVDIESISGSHMRHKTDDNDIHFHINDKLIKYFPRGMGKFYKNLKGIVIWHTKLKEIHQMDLMAYPKLNNLFLSSNDIEIIEDGLFDYNLDIEVIIFENTKIFHIGLTVFGNLRKLVTLFLNGNKCTNSYSVNNRALSLKVIRDIRRTCTSSDFVNLMRKLENLEEISENSVIANSQIFSQNVMNYLTEFKDSKFANFAPLKQRFQNFIQRKIKSALDGACSIEDRQQNILHAVDMKIEELESRLTRKIEEIFDEKLEKVMENVRKIMAML